MVLNWQEGLLSVMRTLAQIFTAGVSVTAFSLLLYALTFNLRDRVARSFAIILIWVTIVFTAEALGSSISGAWQIDFWLRVQWVGIIFLPASYFHFSDSILATTGQPSRWRRWLLVRLAYLVSILFLVILPTDLFVGPVVLNRPPAVHLQPTWLTYVFTLYYLIMMVLTWYNFARSYRRTITPTSQRRMIYLIVSALAPAIGSFPYLLFGSGLVTTHGLIFWSLVVVSNLGVGALMVVMAYAVAFFGVPWPDRVVKSRLFKWLMRGPLTASVTLGMVTITRRAGNVLGQDNQAVVLIVMVASVLIMEYLITLFSPIGEKLFFWGNDREDLTAIRRLEDRLLTRNDMRQFLEMVLAAICDRIQAGGAYLATINSNGLGLLVTVGTTGIEKRLDTNQIVLFDLHDSRYRDFFHWGDDFVMLLVEEGSEEIDKHLLGLLGICGIDDQKLSEDDIAAVKIISDRAELVLHDRAIQQEAFRSLQTVVPEIGMIEQMRAQGRIRGIDTIMPDGQADSPELTQWVKEALVHYWGGPKLTENPLVRLQVVKTALEDHEGNQVNAMRAILKEAIERVKPEGDRRFTAEWILYNILDMKFMEGRKVRDIALRLAVSEADLYRKQRVAIEAVANAILDMEFVAQKNINKSE